MVSQAASAHVPRGHRMISWLAIALNVGLGLRDERVPLDTPLLQRPIWSSNTNPPANRTGTITSSNRFGDNSPIHGFGCCSRNAIGVTDLLTSFQICSS